MTLAGPFLAALDPALRASFDGPALAPTLDAIAAAARAAWPSVTIAPDRFAAWLAARCPAPADLVRLHAGDLFLACACAAGVPEALAAFEIAYRPTMDAVLARMRIDGAARDDLRQRLRQKLFVGAAPAIAEYAGTGELGAWLRVVLVRFALNHLRDHRRDRTMLPLEDGLMMALSAPAADPELELMKRAYHAQFQEAFQEAAQTLSTRDRNLLRMHFVDGVPLEKLGVLHQVHRTTVSRWLTEAQQTLLTGTRRALHARLQIGPGELDSIMRLIQSRLELNLEDVLASKS